MKAVFIFNYFGLILIIIDLGSDMRTAELGKLYVFD